MRWFPRPWRTMVPGSVAQLPAAGPAGRAAGQRGEATRNVDVDVQIDDTCVPRLPPDRAVGTSPDAALRRAPVGRPPHLDAVPAGLCDGEDDARRPHPVDGGVGAARDDR